MIVQNRVVVSPMCQYSADDGTVGNWHLVHLGGFAVPLLKDGEASVSLSQGKTGYSSLVAVQQKRARAATAAKGDADSVTVATSGDTTTFTWIGKVDASSGVVSNVRAAIFAIDSNDGGTSFTDTSAVSVSATSNQFNIDADRPAGPDKLSLIHI